MDRYTDYRSPDPCSLGSSLSKCHSALRLNLIAFFDIDHHILTSTIYPLLQVSMYLLPPPTYTCTSYWPRAIAIDHDVMSSSMHFAHLLILPRASLTCLPVCSLSRHAARYDG